MIIKHISCAIVKAYKQINEFHFKVMWMRLQYNQNNLETNVLDFY